MEGPRPVRPDEFASLLELIDATFPGYSDGMGAAYPLLFDYKNSRNLWVFEDNGRIISIVKDKKPLLISIKPSVHSRSDLILILFILLPQIKNLRYCCKSREERIMGIGF